MKKYYAKLSVISTAILSLAFAMPAHAADLGYLNFFGLGAVLSVLDAVGYLLGYIAGLFVFIGGTLVNWTLDLNAQILNSPTISIGWVVSRDIANLGFVLLLIVIAFATILRFENYQMKKTLFRLIVVALLINFSMVFAGLFIDFSGVLTNFFLNKATNYNQSDLGPGLANIFQTSKILQVTERQDMLDKLVSGIASDPNKHFPFTASVFFVAGFTIIVAISLISLSAMLFMRYIWLTMLLILMPIALMLSTWPDLSDKWSNWWSEFMRWTFFAPAVSFFLYLALSIAEHPIAKVEGIDNIGLTFANFGQLLGQMISVLGILLGGMYTANKMAITGSSTGYAVANKVKGFLTGGAGLAGGATAYAGNRYGLGGLNRLSTSFADGKTINERLRGFAASGAGLPIIGTAFQNLNSQLKKSGEQSIDNWMKHYDAMDPAARKNSYEGRIISPDERAGLMASMANKGQMKDLKESPEFSRYAQSAVTRGGDVAKALINKDPELAKFKVERIKFPNNVEFDRQQRAEIGKAIAGMSMDAINDLRSELLTQNPDYIAQARNSLILKFGEQRSHEDKMALYASMASKLRSIRASTFKTGDDESMEKNLATKLKSMAKSPAWAGYIEEEFFKKGAKLDNETETE